jgi:peptide/nickel transport system permease protein
MIVYTIRRLLTLIPVLLCVTFLTFAIIQVTPGDPVVLMLGKYATPERVAEMREQLGLNDPMIVQYVRYVWNAAYGDLGKSFRGQIPVLKDILTRFPSTLELTVSAMAVSIVVGVPTGILAATSRRKWIERLIMGTSIIGISIPNFWLAVILVIVFGVTLKWVPVTTNEGLRSLILPTIALAVYPSAVLARLTRSSILEVIREDYIRTARAKGITDRAVTWVHMMRNALIPVVTVIGLQFAGLLGGAVFTESVFARSGLGRFAVNAIAARDYPQIQGMVLFTALVYVLLNLAVDLLYGYLDPRIRYD